MADLTAQDIRELVDQGELIIEPFHEGGEAFGLSYGLSSAGYDIRLGKTVWLWPGWGRLSFAFEKIGLPAYLRGKVENKSTNARLFIDASSTTNLEPGWRGFLTIELRRGVPWPVRLPAGYPIAQVIFSELTRPTEKPYSGKYSDQPPKAVPAIAAPWIVRWGLVGDIPREKWPNAGSILLGIIAGRLTAPLLWTIIAWMIIAWTITIWTFTKLTWKLFA